MLLYADSRLIKNPAASRRGMDSQSPHRITLTPQGAGNVPVTGFNSAKLLLREMTDQTSIFFNSPLALSQGFALNFTNWLVPSASD